MTRVIFVLVLAATMCLATPILSTSYTATPGQGKAQSGTYNYFDETGTQLTDGVFGVNDWRADLGNGHAYEWVGWLTVDPTITFAFASPVNITQVLIDFNRSQRGGGISLPSNVNIGGTGFALVGNEIPEATRGGVPFNVNLNGISSLTITLTHNPASRNWVFVDEIQFDDSGVPEPGTFVFAGLGLLVAGYARLRRRG
jgi:hypothetical protein